MHKSFLLQQKSWQLILLRLLQTERSKKTAEATGYLAENKIAEKTTNTTKKNTYKDPEKFHKYHNQHVKKNRYHQKSDNKLLMNFDYCNYKHIEKIEYQEIIDLLDCINNQPLKVGTRNRVDMNDDTYGTYNTNSQFKPTTLESRLCDCSDANILIKETIIVVRQGADPRAIAANRNNKQAIF